MKIGSCYSVDDALYRYPREADYVELSAMEIYGLCEEKFEQLCEAVRLGKIKTYSCNGLVPGNIRLCGEDFDPETVRSYCEFTFSRLAALGITVLVFGSSKAKHIPDGFSREVAYRQLIEAGRILADCAKMRGQRVVIEPLSYNEVNVINTVEEAAMYAHDIDRENVGLLVDYYHFINNGEDVCSLYDTRELIWHTHFAVPVVRTFMKSAEDEKHIHDFVKMLRDIGYEGAISYEGNPNTPSPEFSRSLSFMRRAANN